MHFRYECNLPLYKQVPETPSAPEAHRAKAKPRPETGLPKQGRMLLTRDDVAGALQIGPVHHDIPLH